MPQDSLHIKNKAKQQNTYDAIVVGSGISGGWAAKELCEKGLKTLVLERGRPVEHIKDYTDATKDIWELEHRGAITREDKRNSPVQTKIYAYNEVSKHFFVKDLENPYIQTKPWLWMRGYQVGGRSLVWGRQCYRWSDLDFEANAKEGIGIDWPIRYKDLEPWYDYVEPFVGISGSEENLPQLPDSKFLPAMDLNCVEKDVAERIKKIYKDERRLIVGRTANHTRQVEGRGPCQFRNKCSQGCPFSGYFSSNSATLPAALKTGNLTIRPYSIVTEVLYDKDKKRATGVRVLDSETGQTVEYYSRIVFINASTINTAFILLHSVSDVFPNGFGNSSGQLGHNLMDHHLGVGASGSVSGFEDKYYYGNRPTIAYMPRFRNLGVVSENSKPIPSDFTRGYSFGGGAWRGQAERQLDGIPIGAGLKALLTEPGPWSFDLSGLGEVLPYFYNKVSLDRGKKDKWGLPLIAVDCELKDNEKKMRRDMRQTAAAMLEDLGLTNISTWDSTEKEGQRIFSVHEMGTARMGRDPKTSVLNQHNQLHDVKNVFITDGSCMASSACQEPSLTYMALTARACDFAVHELRRGNL
ncbi:GMC oxidoreductase [Flavitalea flava]